MRCTLLVEVVLQFLAIELDKRLARGDPIAEIGAYPANHAVDFGGHGDLVLGRQRADYIEAASNRFLTDRFGLDRLAGLLGNASLFRARVGTSRDHPRQGPDHNQYEGELRHTILILIRAGAPSAPMRPAAGSATGPHGVIV
jgi:hypothetical protein